MDDNTERGAFEDLERMIFAARDYAVPSEDLRPRTLEKARELGRFQFQLRRLSLCALIALLVWGAGIPVGRMVSSWRKEFVAPFPEDVHRAARELSARQNTSKDWGMVEAFQQIRDLAKPPAKPRFDLPGNLQSRR